MKVWKPFFRTIKILSALIIIATIVTIFFFKYHTAVTKNIDSYTYALPFGEGKKFRVVQGYGGLFSHIHIAALDFEMPIGTPVHAARAGVLYAFKEDSDVGGPLAKYKNRANYIIIKHSDGSFGCYWHLQHNGVLVKKGYIFKGQQIGFSGATGFVMKPHLHFSVKNKLNYDMNSFVRTIFETTEGVRLLNSTNVYERPRK